MNAYLPSIYQPFVRGSHTATQYEQKVANRKNDKPLTPSDIVSLSRPLLAAKAAYMLRNGQKPVMPWVIAMGASDWLDGTTARIIDKILPDSGWGCTAHGADNDIYADAAALLEICTGALSAPNVSIYGKLAVTAILAQEGYKFAWALNTNRHYINIVAKRRSILTKLAYANIIDEIPTIPEKIPIPSATQGKSAMADKFTAVALAVATNDLPQGKMRTGCGLAAVAFAAVGTWNGEMVRRTEYESHANDIIQSHINSFTEESTLLRAT
ncbi:MAG TPA: hypothetical protein VFN56_00295 [Candidatus Saccharimonadales bacterium]|nr:hypothetical protein [Candidatus Saccharimonadales bacterium]